MGAQEQQEETHQDGGHGGRLNDCVEQMADTVDELSKTMAALQHLRRGADFRWQMSNAETWVSAAFTYEDTCLDGFKEIDGKVRSDVRRKLTNVARININYRKKSFLVSGDNGGKAASRSGSLRKLSRYSSRRAMQAVRSFRSKLYTIDEAST